jgi:excinuclease ABC subunit B
MQQTLDETNRRREKQLAYNEKHGLTPKQVVNNTVSLLGERIAVEMPDYTDGMESTPILAADPVVQYMNRSQLRKAIDQTKRLMRAASRKMEFIEAAQYRDEMFKLQDLMKGKKA